MSLTLHFQRAMPVLQVQDLGRSLAFYCNMLGFNSHGSWGSPSVFAIVQRGAVTFALDQSRDGRTPPLQQYWAAYIYVSDAAAVLRDLTGHNVEIARPLCDTEYGCRDFDVRDPDGHLIGIGQVLKPDALGPGLDFSSLGRDGDRS